MDFLTTWNLPLGTNIQVKNGKPPPSNTEGMPYKEWRSHNFTGILEDKSVENEWKYLKFEVDPLSTPEQVAYLAYTVPEGGDHVFTEIV